MQIKVNGQDVEIFSGACVKDALRKYSRSVLKLVKNARTAVFDRHGHEVGLNGELAGGEEFFIKSIELAGPKP